MVLNQTRPPMLCLVSHRAPFLLFSLYINDTVISAAIESEIGLFADDCVCYREIKGIEDTVNFRKILIV